MLLILRASRTNEARIEALVFRLFEKKATLRVKNTTEATVEFIYEMSRRVLEGAGREKNITDQFYELGGVEYLNIVAQNDDVSS